MRSRNSVVKVKFGVVLSRRHLRPCLPPKPIGNALGPIPMYQIQGDSIPNATPNILGIISSCDNGNNWSARKFPLFLPTGCGQFSSSVLPGPPFASRNWT